MRITQPLAWFVLIGWGGTGIALIATAIALREVYNVHWQLAGITAATVPFWFALGKRMGW